MAENVYSELVEPILYYGDNLDILRRYIENKSVDLVYLDPLFKSDQDYNILFAIVTCPHKIPMSITLRAGNRNKNRLTWLLFLLSLTSSS